jgi:hypothetical protein
VSSRSAAVLGLGLLATPLAYAAAVAVTCWWYERYFLPSIAGDED